MQASQPGSQCWSFGFTLLELLVVILILSMALGMVLRFNAGQVDTVKLKVKAQEIVQLFRATKSYAVVRGRQNRCIYDPESGMIVEELQGKQVTFPAPYTLERNEQSIQDKEVLVIFYPDGSAQADSLKVGYRDAALTLTIDPFFGDVALATD